MDGLFELAEPPVCICVPFSPVAVEPWCPVHDPQGQIEIPVDLRVRDDKGAPLGA